MRTHHCFRPIDTDANLSDALQAGIESCLLSSTLSNTYAPKTRACLKAHDYKMRVDHKALIAVLKRLPAPNAHDGSGQIVCLGKSLDLPRHTNVHSRENRYVIPRASRNNFHQKKFHKVV